MPTVAQGDKKLTILFFQKNYLHIKQCELLLGWVTSLNWPMDERIQFIKHEQKDTCFFM